MSKKKVKKESGIKSVPLSYSYANVVKQKDKNGKTIYFNKDGKRKVRVKEIEFLRVQKTKDYFKKKNGKGWIKKLNSARKEMRSITDAQNKIDKAKHKQTDKTVYTHVSTFANSMPSEIETNFLMFGNVKLIFNDETKKDADGTVKIKASTLKLNNSNILDARHFFTEVADVFYDEWNELKGTAAEPNSPQILYHWSFAKLDGNTSMEVYLNQTSFSFSSTKFFKEMLQLYKNNFG